LFNKSNRLPRYSELAKIANANQWSKKTYNNAISVVRCAFDYGYRDHPEKHNPASGLTCLRMTKKDRPSVAPFTIRISHLKAACRLGRGHRQLR
jgi:hypothetical protein